MEQVLETAYAEGPTRSEAVTFAAGGTWVPFFWSFSLSQEKDRKAFLDFPSPNRLNSPKLPQILHFDTLGQNQKFTDPEKSVKGRIIVGQKFTVSLFVVTILLALVFIQPPAISAAVENGLSPETAYSFTNMPQPVALTKGQEFWFIFSFGPPNNYDKMELRLDFRSTLGKDAGLHLYNYGELNVVVYDPSHVDAFLKARLASEPLPKPTGRLFPVYDGGSIKYWSWDDGDRTGVDLQTMLGKGAWLGRIKYTGTNSWILGNLTQNGYCKSCAHP